MVDRKGLGLEIGPSHNPLAPKRQGFSVSILDSVTKLNCVSADLALVSV